MSRHVHCYRMTQKDDLELSISLHLEIVACRKMSLSATEADFAMQVA